MLRELSATHWPIRATSSRESPRWAAAPATFSTMIVAPVPRRPGPSLSPSSPVASSAWTAGSVATSSSTRTTRVSTSSTAWRATVKFMTSPV